MSGTRWKYFCCRFSLPGSVLSFLAFLNTPLTLWRCWLHTIQANRLSTMLSHNPQPNV